MVKRAVHMYILNILSSENKRYSQNPFIKYLEHTELLSKLDLQCEFGDDIYLIFFLEFVLFMPDY